jgi:hypothetical protein
MRDLLSGLAWVAVGVALVLGRERIFHETVAAHERFWGWLGIARGSDRVNRILVTTVVMVIGVSCLLAGWGDLYKAVTGREWFLRYARWGDVWPF